jgi:hypothetical protein
MICYKDRAFCSQSCFNLECDRNYNHAINGQRHLQEEDRLPISIANFKDSNQCKGFQPFAERMGMRVEDEK